MSNHVKMPISVVEVILGISDPDMPLTPTVMELANTAQNATGVKAIDGEWYTYATSLVEVTGLKKGTVSSNLGKAVKAGELTAIDAGKGKLKLYHVSEALNVLDDVQSRGGTTKPTNRLNVLSAYFAEFNLTGEGDFEGLAGENLFHAILEAADEAHASKDAVNEVDEDDKVDEN